MAASDEWFAPRTNRRLRTSASDDPKRDDRDNIPRWNEQPFAHTNASYIPDTPVKDKPRSFTSQSSIKNEPFPGSPRNDEWVSELRRHSSRSSNVDPFMPDLRRQSSSASNPGRTISDSFHQKSQQSEPDPFQDSFTFPQDTSQVFMDNNEIEDDPFSDQSLYTSPFRTVAIPSGSRDRFPIRSESHDTFKFPIKTEMRLQHSDSNREQWMLSNGEENLPPSSVPREDVQPKHDSTTDNHVHQPPNSVSHLNPPLALRPTSRTGSLNSSGEFSGGMKARTGYSIPTNEMSMDESGYLNRSNTSLNKSTSSLTKIQAGMMHSTPVEKPVERDQSTTSLKRTPPSNQHPDCNISFNVQDVSPLFLIRRLALLFDNNKYEEFAVLVQRISLTTLKTILAQLPIKEIMDVTPHSLGIIHALYIKYYNTDPQTFPIKYLIPGTLISRLIEWFSTETDIVTEDNFGHCAHYVPLIHELLGIVAHVSPDVLRRLYNRERELRECLEGLGSHSLVDTSDLKLMNLHDALKVEFQAMSHQLKAGLQKLDELSLSHKHPISRSLHRGKAPSAASHQRMMQMSHNDIQQRLIKNKSLLNVVEPAMTNTYLAGLLHTLEDRIEADKNVIFIFSELNKDLMGSLAPDKQLAPVFKQYSLAYQYLLNTVRSLPPCSIGCGVCGSGLRRDWEQESGQRTENDSLERTEIDEVSLEPGSSQSFAGTPTSVPSRSSAPIDRDKAHRTQAGVNGSEPIGIRVTPANGSAHNIPFSLPANTGSPLEERQEVDALKTEVNLLRKELTSCRDSIKQLQDRETLLKDRLSEQALKQIEKGSTKFEDLNLGDNRPTQLIRRYGNLYSESRLDAFDALEDLPEIADFDDLKGKLLFSVVVLAFRSVQRALSETRSQVRTLLCIPEPGAKTSFAKEPIVRELEDTISVFLRKSVDRYDTDRNVEEVCHQVWSTLYDYPSLKQCSGLRQYITDCVRLAWALSVQNPPLTIDYDCKAFEEDVHTRFHTSDPDSDSIQSLLWPVLREGEKGPCVYKGVVIT